MSSAQDSYIAPYEQGNRYNPDDPYRARKLLVHRGEITELKTRVKGAGLTLVPLRLYDRKGVIKVEVALARGKQVHDKRDAIAKREAGRQIERAEKRRWA